MHRRKERSAVPRSTSFQKVSLRSDLGKGILKYEPEEQTRRKEVEISLPKTVWI